MTILKRLFRKEKPEENVIPMMDRGRLAAEARAVFENPAFKLAVNGVKEYHTKTFLRANASNEEVLEAHRDIAALTRVVSELVKFANDEKMAQHREEKHRG